ncbi:MAG TPA: hypothetical protein VNQ76_16110 [Planctomicrobium sp.]|nr:hypothetical protein [Planctomicrobium sp.]
MFLAEHGLTKAYCRLYGLSMSQTIRLGDICKRLSVPERDARYVMERGFVPKGIDGSPQSGNHRQFGPAQAFWLAIVLKLKENGIPVPLAAAIATHGEQVLRGTAQNLGWDWSFSPRSGRFDTEHQYFLDIGDRTYVRLATNANPSGRGKLECFPWHNVHDVKKASQDLTPYLMMRLDLTLIARHLAGLFDDKTGSEK